MNNLPDLILLEDYNNNWEQYIETIYRIFNQDIKSNQFKYKGKRISLKKHPCYKGKEKSFWHLTSLGDIEEERMPDIRRCERICWIRYIIDNRSKDFIKERKNIRNNKINICLALESFDYIVILGQRKDYFVLLSAYPIEHSWRRNKFEKEYNDYKKQESPT